MTYDPFFCLVNLCIRNRGRKSSEREVYLRAFMLDLLYGNALPDLLGEPDEKSFGAADVTEPIHAFVLNHFADELCAVLAEPGEQLIKILHGEHDA